MKRVLAGRNRLKVAQAIIVAPPVSVVYHQAVGNGTVDREPHDSVGKHLLAIGQTDSDVSVNSPTGCRPAVQVHDSEVSVDCERAGIQLIKCVAVVILGHVVLQLGRLGPSTAATVGGHLLEGILRLNLFLGARR